HRVVLGCPSVFEQPQITEQHGGRLLHHVRGHDLSSTFTQDNKIVGVGVGFSYLERWQADIAYTVFTGGEVYSGTDPAPPSVPGTPGNSSQSAQFATRANDSADRDFLAVSVSYAF
ncbi:MAG: hypothetical protein CMH65_05770, partial [Nevskiales bacterium]|nr:hypothetical protein [Nevskiales bacterium]